MTSLLTQVQNETAAEIGVDVQGVATQGMAVHGNDPKALQVLAAGIATGIEALERDHPQLIALLGKMLVMNQIERFKRGIRP